MTATAKKVLASAMRLSEEDRCAVADELLASIGPPDSFEQVTEDELIDELERRAAELAADPSSGIPWETIRDER